MNKTKLGFLSLALAIAGAGVGVAFLIVYGISSFSNILYMWLMILGFVIMGIFTLVSIFLFMKKDDEIASKSKFLNDPKKPH